MFNTCPFSLKVEYNNVEGLMDIETVEEMKNLAQNKVDLNMLKNNITRDELNKTRVKFFRSYARNSDALISLQEQINDFLNQGYFIKDVKFNVQKNFLLASIAGEYEEDAYAMVIYEI